MQRRPNVTGLRDATLVLRGVGMINVGLGRRAFAEALVGFPLGGVALLRSMGSLFQSKNWLHQSTLPSGGYLLGRTYMTETPPGM